ncbi:MAG: hypothetical protein R3E79_43380 [Caldilineaceae bacterium]
MIHALVQLHVTDFATFWAGFQSRGFALRQAHGSLGSQVFHNAADPQQVTILFQWDSKACLEAFFQDPRVRESICKGGVTDAPSITLLTKAGELEA